MSQIIQTALARSWCSHPAFVIAFHYFDARQSLELSTPISFIEQKLRAAALLKSIFRTRLTINIFDPIAKNYIVRLGNFVWYVCINGKKRDFPV